MKINNIKEFTNGWFIGNFEPSILKQEQFEIAIHSHKKGDLGDKHFHKIATEINVIISGSIRLGVNIILKSGDIWTIYPNQIEKVEFLEDTKLVVIKTPSVPGDKYYHYNFNPLILGLEDKEWLKNPYEKYMEKLYEINSSNAGAGNTVDSTIHTEIQTDKIS